MATMIISYPICYSPPQCDFFKLCEQYLKTKVDKIEEGD